ncbi:MAG: hypothetical protein CME36_07840 [unclassified Hahellaceae]|nr:hypothetical protein [Hahellaceae bacterium]
MEKVLKLLTLAGMLMRLLEKRLAVNPLPGFVCLRLLKNRTGESKARSDSFVPNSCQRLSPTIAVFP